jgi:hypothetical protein
MVEPRAGRVGKMRGFRRADRVLHRLGAVRDLVGDLLQFRPCADDTATEFTSAMAMASITEE